MVYHSLATTFMLQLYLSVSFPSYVSLFSALLLTRQTLSTAMRIMMHKVATPSPMYTPSLLMDRLQSLPK